MSNVTINVKNDGMLGRLNQEQLHVLLIEQQKELDRFRPFKSTYEMKKEIERLNNKIKRIVYQCYKSDMSYEEFKQIWVNAMGKIYEPSQIEIDELEKELGVDKE